MFRCPLIALLAVILFSQLAAAASADTGLARHKKMFVVPAPGPVVIDGKFNDWDLSGQIGMYVVSETADMQSAKLALMYDRNALYVSAIVRDPSPMMNRHDPQSDADKGWNGDSCQLRLSLDPSLPYPLIVGWGVGDMDNPKIVHLTLWYYTDKSEPCLAIQDSMHFKSPRKEWEPFGAVPPQFFKAKYLKMADGRGYTFEYAIPWTTLGATAPLHGGDLVAGTVQFNWSTPDGLTTAGGSAWAYDLMSGPGFPYQTTSCWGKLIFSSKGNVPRNIVEAGVPPEKPLPLKFEYSLPADSQITLQIMDKDNLVRRILVAQGNRQAGKNVELWDGMDWDDHPLPAGQYTVKGIYHQPITQKFLFSPHNSGQPPYKTDDGTGAWGGDEGDPQAVVSVGDGLIMSWAAAEAGSGLIRTDLTGRKQWGTQHCAAYLATDGKHIFAAGDGFFNDGQGIELLDAADSRPLLYGNGKNIMSAPPGGDNATNKVTGLVYGGGCIYASFRSRDMIAVYDLSTGDLKTTWPVPSPGDLAYDSSGRLLAVSAGNVVRIESGNISPFASTNLDDPHGIALGPDGAVYVANAGKLQAVSVFDSSGSYVRSIGKIGGRPWVGDYDRNGILEPGGIALDSNGHLWVAERLDSPRRISEWDAKSGAFVNEFFGGCGYFGYSYIDPQNPNEIYCHNVLWSIDWAHNTCAPVSTIWRPTTPNMMWATGESGYPDHPVFFTAANGKQYCYGGSGSFTSVVGVRSGDVYKPFLALITLARGNIFYGDSVQFPIMSDLKAYPNGTYLWQDLNGDQTIEADELTPVSDLGTGIPVIDQNLDIWCGAKLLKPTRIDADGRATYSLSDLAANPGANITNPGLQWLDPQDGNIYNRSDLLGKYTPDGTRLWAFPGMRDWESSLSLPMQTPGRLYGLTNVLGVAGDFTGNSDYFGTYHLFTREGVYVGMLMRDGRDGKGLGPDITASETLTGQLVKPSGMNRYFLLAGASDARVTEIFGLDTVKELPDEVLTLTDADVKVATDARARYDALISRSKPLSIARGLSGLASAEATTKTLDSSRNFSVTAAYDKSNLYISYNVTAPYGLINSEPDPMILFKGGNCLDIQIATDANANPSRTTAAAGDIRILVTRQNSAAGPTDLAVVYRPHVAETTTAPHVLSSPTGTEKFDQIEVSKDVTLSYQHTAAGFTALVTIPKSVSGLNLKPGDLIKMDVGMIYGNATGNETSARSYWSNNSFSANVTNDIPSEARLEPAQWGSAVAE